MREVIWLAEQQAGNITRRTIGEILEHLKKRFIYAQLYPFIAAT